jgi:hypothetical protein
MGPHPSESGKCQHSGLNGYDTALQLLSGRSECGSIVPHSWGLGLFGTWKQPTTRNSRVLSECVPPALVAGYHRGNQADSRNQAGSDLDANGASASSIGNSLRGCLGGRAQRNRPRNGKPSKDRDVLAAAVVCGAQTVVTFNLRDFPADALAAWNVEAQRPDEFLIHQYYLDPAAVMAILREQAA